jgi:hypothetical protein
LSLTHMLERRDFLRHAVVLTAGAAGAVLVPTARADASPTTTAWLLDPAWGYPLGVHHRTSCHCRACPPHAANKVFADQPAAVAGRAHGGCLCQPFAIVVQTATYNALFTPGVTSVDRRDPAVAAALAPPGQPPAAVPSSPTPAIISFTPGRGRVGDSVVITGAGLAGTTSAMFGDALVTEMVVDSDSQLTTTVPSTASTGLLSVVVPSGTLRSVARFVVVHKRRISFLLSGDRGSGLVSATDGQAACVADVPVKLQHLLGGSWKTVANVTTESDGSFTVKGLSGAGGYRAVAIRSIASSGDVGLKAVSPTRKR